MRSFLMIGQSNMAGRGQMGELPPIMNPAVHMFRNGQWLAAKEPVNPDRVFSGESMQISFADKLQRTLHDEIGLITCAEGGTLLKEWAPGSWLYNRMIDTAREARKTSELSGIMWIQGENDGYSEENALAYTPGFLRMLDQAFADLALPVDFPVVVAQLCPFLNLFNMGAPEDKRVPYYQLIIDQQTQLENLRPNIRCVRTQGLTGKPDHLHYDTPALRELGLRFADAYLTFVKA